MSAALIRSGQLGLGLRRDPAGDARLLATSKTFSLMASARAPKAIDNRSWLESLSQGAMGSCEGNDLAANGTILNWYKTGEKVRMSRMWCYLRSQYHFGNLGSDSGASIPSGIETAKTDGFCTEKTFPYPNPVRYSTAIPPEAFTEAKPHVIHSSTVLKNYAEGFAYLATGVGVISIGINWVESTAENQNGLIETESGSSLGGHALSINGYTERKDKQGRNYLLLLNSHGTGWGSKGWAEISPAMIDYWIQTGMGFIGLSDLVEYGERDLRELIGEML